MFGSEVLDVVVGLVFVYFLLSIICTAANEIIATLLSLRARNLAKGIANLFADKRVKGLAELFYDHPLIRSLSRGAKKPSYIPAHTFALAFLDGIAPTKGDGTAVMTEVKAAIDELPSDSELKRLLLILLQQAGDDLTEFRAGIETWFNDAMSRVSGWYKRKSQVITVMLALVVTGLTNADTLQIVKSLSVDSALRAAIVAQAQDYVKQHRATAARQPGQESVPSSVPISPGTGGRPTAVRPPSVTQPNPLDTTVQTLGSFEQLGIPLGWQTMPKKEEWRDKVIGLVLTIFAVSLGAPFWFDLLGRIAKMRSTGPVPESAANRRETRSTEM